MTKTCGHRFAFPGAQQKQLPICHSRESGNPDTVHAEAGN